MNTITNTPGPDLSGVHETLLIPLAARANAAAQNPDLDFVDPRAVEVYRKFEDKAARFLEDRSSMRGSVVRAQWFDIVARRFLQRYPDGFCVSMGSGLDARAERIPMSNFNEANWIDIDVADVVALRETLLPPLDRVTSVSADLTEPAWLSRLDWPEGRPALFLAEGVMMYLTNVTAPALLRAICTTADRRKARIELAFDFSSPLMVSQGRRHPSIAKTDASLGWALRRPSDLRALDTRLRCIGTGDIMSRSGLGPAMFCALYRTLTLGRWFYACAHFERTESA